MPCHVMDIPISQSKQAKQNNPSFDLPKHSHELMTNIHHGRNKSFHMMPKKEMFKWSNFSKQFKLFWTNICAHQETKHPFCFSATHYKQQKMKHLCEFKNTTNSFLSPDVCKLSAAVSHIHWAKPLIAVKNETNGTTEKSLDWRGGDWPFHHALPERGLLLICEEAEQKTRFSWFLGQRSCSTVCISTLHSE